MEVNSGEIAIRHIHKLDFGRQLRFLFDFIGCVSVLVWGQHNHIFLHFSRAFGGGIQRSDCFELHRSEALRQLGEGVPSSA